MPKRYTLSDRASGQYKTSLQPQNDEDKEPMEHQNAFFGMQWNSEGHSGGINPLMNFENNLRGKIDLNV